MKLKKIKQRKFGMVIGKHPYFSFDPDEEILALKINEIIEYLEVLKGEL